MNFEFFAFLVFMSLVSFAVAFLAYGMVVRFMGQSSFASRMGQIILVPACIVFYDFITIAAPEGYRYLVGCIPMLLIAVLLLYYRFFRGESFTNAPAPSEIAALTKEERKFSKKSQRIHAARKNRGRE